MTAANGSTAVALAMDQAPLIEDEPEDEQLGLFAPAQTELGKKKAKKLGNGVGRPPGARNKRTERTVAFLLRQHRDPRAVLLEIAEANVNDLAALLGCSVHEALVEKRLAAIGVLPYVAQKLPLSLDVTNRKLVFLNINLGDGPGAVSDGIGLSGPLVKILDGESTEEPAPAPPPAEPGENP